MVSKTDASLRISRRKSCAAKRPSPSCPGSVFDVAAIDTPCAVSSASSREISMVSPGSSSSNSSMHSTEWSDNRSTACMNPSAPTRCVTSTNVANDLGSGIAW
ncbi:Uncharacterised protein [Mycobacteroides abscessus subsp. abscessus]|nr:Uncharacterised protein [Mycobacteroides abscessus subsp. abscessus]